MRTAEIRRRFLDYFAERGHTVVPSAPLHTPDPGRAPDLDPAAGRPVTAPSPTAPSIVARLAAQAARMEAATSAAVGQLTLALPSLGAQEAEAVLVTAVPIPVRGRRSSWRNWPDTSLPSLTR